MTTSLSPGQAARQGWLSVLAKAPAARLAELMEATLPDLPAHELLRAPEIGTVLLRGRIGGTGAPFNFGEMTVTRCSLRLVPGAKAGKAGSAAAGIGAAGTTGAVTGAPCEGAVGHAMVQGRDLEHARRAALADALLQGPEGAALAEAIIAPLKAEAEARNALRREKAAATKVEFFTMVRGEDQ